MAVSQRWVCFECAQTTDSSKPFCECTFCQVRFCFACQNRHPQSHYRYLVTLQKVPLGGNSNSTQRCVGCEEFVGLRYHCQACPFAQCLGCWRALGINRHEHRAFTLYELREDYGCRKLSLPPRSQSTPITTSSRSTASATPPLRTSQTQPAESISPPTQAQASRTKRNSLSRGLKKAYALSQKNTLTKVATGIAIGTVSVALGADLSGIVDGFDAFDIGDDGSGGGIDSSNAPASDFAGVDGQSFGEDSSMSDGQGFSGLQNGSAETTEWMQQQYWQNVQLPNLAGPTMTPAMLNATI